jgi:preprotein translocase subunit SecA
MSADTQWLDAVMSKYVAGQLARFRAELEGRTHQPVGAVQTDAARLLSDLCRHFGLDEEQHTLVLGEAGVRHVEERYVRRHRQRTSFAHRADLAASANSEMPIR